MMLYKEDKNDAIANPLNTRCVNCGFRWNDHYNRRCPCKECETVHMPDECPAEAKEPTK